MTERAGITELGTFTRDGRPIAWNFYVLDMSQPEERVRRFVASGGDPRWFGWSPVALRAEWLRGRLN